MENYHNDYEKRLTELRQSGYEILQNPLTKDIIFGSILNYRIEDVACWINSIIACGFNGDVIILNFGCPEETLDFLASKGCRIYNCDLNGLHIVVQRFMAMFTILHSLEMHDYRCVFATDVKDVIFQKNPSLRFKDNNRSAVILASTENIQYNNEEWGNNNLHKCFPHLYEWMRWQVIYNAGTMAGEFELMRDLFLHIYHLSLVGINMDPQPDQAAYNILINTKPFINQVYFTEDKDAWVANIGTSLADNIKDKYFPFLLDPPPYYDKNGTVFNNNNESYCIVHQYDRCKKLYELIREKFGKI